MGNIWVGTFDRLSVYDIQTESFIQKKNFPDDSSAFIADTVLVVNYTIQRALNENFDDTDFGIALDFDMLVEEDSTIEPLLIYYPPAALEIFLTPTFFHVFFDE